MKHFLIYALITSLKQSSNNQPARLNKKENESSFDKTCERIAPYILLISLIILCTLLFVVLVKYGANLTGTEANQFYYHMND